MREIRQSATRLSLTMALLMVSVQVQAIGTIPDEKAEKAAKQDLGELKQAIKDAAGQVDKEPPDAVKELIKVLNIKSPDELSFSPLELGVPMREYRVDFGGLKRFRQGDDPTKLLVDTNRVTYPLTVNRQVRSLLAVRKSKDGKEWKTAGWGSSDFAKRLSKYRKLDPTPVGSSPAPPPPDFMVWVLELNLCFIGTDTGREFKLTSIGDLPKYHLQAGIPVEAGGAGGVFLRIQAEAKARKEGIR